MIAGEDCKPGETVLGTPLPDNNPKTAFGFRKPSFNFTPPVAEMVLGQAMRNGGDKYGAMNWRKNAVSSSVYYNAARRHLSAWLDGEDIAPDSGVHHLGHVMACCAIILDAAAQGILQDDRPTKGTFAAEAEKVIKAFAGAPDRMLNAAAVTLAAAMPYSGDRGDETPEKPKFKVGDRVRWRSEKGGYPNGIFFGTVVGFMPAKESGDGPYVNVKWDPGFPRNDGGYYETSLERVSTPKFKVGDRVRCACSACRDPSWRSPHVGIVKAIGESLLTVTSEKVLGKLDEISIADAELAP